MKKITLFALLACSCFTIQLYSQTGELARHDGKDFSYGVKAGINVATLEAEDSKIKLGATLGLFGELRIAPRGSISVDILYSQQGCNVDHPTINDAGFTLDYLNIPVLLNVYMPSVPGLAIKGGLQPGFLLSSEMKISDISIDAADYFNSIDFSIPLGISYELDFGLLLDFRYNVGVINIWNNDKNEAGVEDASFKNSVFQVTVGYRF